jgi:hypothetical protein
MTQSGSEVLLYDDNISDVALEVAGRKLCEGLAGSATLSFCSGYDTCPWEKTERSVPAEA